ncbi:uncharacterized protein LOC116246727 [Nymphaea colorata]|nr:uncharacterized protein LOC116246727 [Nymphaea colorata]
MGLPENSAMEAPPQQEIGSSRNQNQRNGRITPVQGEKTTPPLTNRPDERGQLHQGPQQPPDNPALTASFFPKPFSEKLLALTFLLHLFAFAILILYLAIGSTSSASRHRLRRPLIWYRPLLTSVPVSLAFSLSYLLLTLRHPALSLQYAFWISPTLSLTAALLVLCTSTAGGNSFGPVLLFLSVFQSIYACWVTPRVPHSSDLLLRSLSAVRPRCKPGLLTWTASVSVISGAWSLFWVTGLVGAVARPLAAVYALALLANLSWTVGVARCLVHLPVARTAGEFIALGGEMRPRAAVEGAARSLGSACLCALVGPAVAALRLVGRAISKVARDDEFLFSCAGCYRGITDHLHSSANNWGLVHVVLHNMSYRPASRRAWESLTRTQLTAVADTDLTGPMCFAAGVAGGAFCLIAVGSWTFATHRSVAASVSLFAFFIGYLMTRIAMAWPQACVGAYHVMYAENPQNSFFDSTISDRVRELQAADA